MVKVMRRIGHLGLLAAAALAFGCAFDLTDVKYQSARLDPAAGPETAFIVAEDAPIHGAPCGYSRSLRKGSRWFAFGRLPEGVVYRSRDQTLTVECSNVFEAYLVVSEGRLVGFYLPVEKGFSPLSEPIPLAVSRQP
jgi:hypothetical protein